MLRRLVLLLLLFFEACACAATGAYTVERAYFHDTQSQMSIGDLGQLAFSPYQGDLRLGFSQGPTWLRFQILPTEPLGLTANPNHSNPFTLIAGPYSLSHIDLYQQIDGHWTVLSAGDRHTRRSDKCPSDLHCFTLNTDNAKPTTVYLKIQSEGIRLIEADIIRDDDLVTVAGTRISRNSTALALANGLLVLGIFFFLLHRTVLLHIYCWFQASVALVLYASSGSLSQLFPALAPETLDDLSNYLQIARVAATILLGWALLIQYEPPKHYQRLVALLLLLSCICVGMVATGHTHEALILGFALFYINPLVQVLGIYKARISLHRLKSSLYFGYGLYMVVLIAGTLAGFGFWQFNGTDGALQRFEDRRLNGVWIGMFVLWVVVSEQASRKLQSVREIQALRLESVRAQAQSDILQERTTLIDMLTHELKTPLGTIKFALASLQRDHAAHPNSVVRIKNIDSSIDRMDQLIERVASSIKLETADVAVHTESIALFRFIHDLSHEYLVPERFKIAVDEAVLVQTSRDSLTIILGNLMNNAYKYASADAIHISASLGRIEVKNLVDEENRPDASRLFERYYRHHAISNQPGIGLGLSLVRTACSRIGATVHFRQQGPWAIFEVLLPH